MTDTADVFEIADFRIKRKLRGSSSSSPCQHLHITIDDEGEIVMCDDCGKQIGAYYALRMLAQRWGSYKKSMSRQREALEELSKKTIVLRAARAVESAWRNQSMVPSCPHCREAIFPDDGFGKTLVNKRMAQRRREAQADAMPTARCNHYGE